MSRLPLCALLALLVVPSYSADILVVLPFPGYSHTMPFMPIFKELGRRGHNLTMITPFKQEPNPQGFNQIDPKIDLEELKANMKKRIGDMNLSSLSFARGPLFQLGGLLFICKNLGPLVLEMTKATLPPPGTHFDLVITEPFFCTETLLAASSMYNAPVVATLPMPLSPFIASEVGNPMAFSYVPNARVPFTDEMSFLERVWNTVVNTVELISHKLYYIPMQDKLMRDMLGQPDLPYLGDLLQNISLVLTETHFSLGYPRPYAKNVLEVGGISVQLAKPLPKDLESFMNEAKDGVIYFSWGSHFEANDADKIVDIMLKSFSKLKQRVVFKWHSAIPNAPSNVLVQKWVPQPSVLAHKNTVLFISHGGINSVYEAAYYGVPVLGTPMFGDQPYNIRILEKIGMAKCLDIGKLDDGISFEAALQESLADSRLRETAKKESRILQDRPISIVDEAAFWIEYIIRHGGSHLQPRTRKMPWYSVALLDVSLFILGVFLLAVFLIYYTISLSLRLCQRKSHKPSSKEKKRQ